MLPRILLFLAAAAALAAANPARAANRNWAHWRGPEQDGVSHEKNLPGDFDPKRGAKGNVVWTQPYGGRSAPLVLDGERLRRAFRAAFRP